MSPKFKNAFSFAIEAANEDKGLYRERRVAWDKGPIDAPDPSVSDIVKLPNGITKGSSPVRHNRGTPLAKDRLKAHRRGTSPSKYLSPNNVQKKADVEKN